MKISQIGEDPFIQIIKERMNNSLPKDVVGIEDDCAVVPFNQDKFLLISTDLLVERCHFLKDKINPEDLGYKAIMVNVSDIAAMGGKALYVLMSIALPNDVEESWLLHYLEGVEKACSEAGIYLIGGDTTGSKKDIYINFSIVGEVEKSHVKYRKDARVGDLICLTAPIGDSLAGFYSMMEGGTNSLTNKHCRPKAHYDEGLWLGKHTEVHAMMDLSDGLYQDLERMMLASRTAAEVILEDVPLSEDFLEFSRKHQWDPMQQAVVSGEEYCLLFTVDPNGFEKLNSEFKKQFSYSLFVVGKVKKGNSVIYLKEGKEIEIQSKAYYHFNENN